MPALFESIKHDSECWEHVTNITGNKVQVPTNNCLCTDAPLTVFSDSDAAADSDTTDASDSDHDLKVQMNDFDDLVESIKQILGPSSGIDANDVDTESLMATMRDYKSHRPDWEKYAFADANVAYTRNGVDTINSKANLLILVWTPGKGSAIHDHANAHCIVKVLQGSIRETLYETPDHITDDESAMQVKRVTDVPTDGVTYMSDTLGLHRMENVGTIPTVSLHLYTPPYASKFGCHIYDKDGVKKLVSMSSLYSDHGVRTTNYPNTC